MPLLGCEASPFVQKRRLSCGGLGKGTVQNLGECWVIPPPSGGCRVKSGKGPPDRLLFKEPPWEVVTPRGDVRGSCLTGAVN